MNVSLAASPDGAWIARRAGARITLHPATRLGDAHAIDLDTEDFDIAFAGPPDQLVAIVRGGRATQVLLYNPPELEVAARAEVDGRAELAGVSGARVALIAGDHRSLVLVRCAPRALIVQPAESGPLVENAVGLEDNGLLVCQAKKIERWDTVVRRPMLRLNLQLPPAPRLLGAAKGAFWSAVRGRDAVYVYRASDGRVFEHQVGGGVVAGASHLASPHVAIATDAGLVRLHVFSHQTVSMGPREAIALAHAMVADEPVLYGCDDGESLWRASLADGAPVERVATKGRAFSIDAVGAAAPVSRKVAPPRGDAHAWRAELVAWTEAALARDHGGALGKPAPLDDPAIPFDAALSALGDRLAPGARLALDLLYGAWLAGTPRLAIAKVAAVLGGGDDAWAEALGAGSLAAGGWISVEGGAIGLAPVVARHLDDATPRAVRVTGEPPQRDAPRGVVIARDLDVAALASRLSAIAVMLAGASLDDAALEAKLADAALIVPLGAAPARALVALADRGGDAIVLAPASAPLPERLASLPSWPPPPPPPDAPPP